MKRIIIIALAVTLTVFAAACSTAPKGNIPVDDNVVAQEELEGETTTVSKMGVTDAIGGWGGGELDSRYWGTVDELGIILKIVPSEEISAYAKGVVEPRTWDVGRDVPYVYEAIARFEIPEERFREENDRWTEYYRENGLESFIFTEEEISALYCGDKDEMNRRLMSPYAFYTGERVLSAFEVMMLGLDDIIKAGIDLDALSEYCGRMREEIPQVSERDVEWYENKLDEMDGKIEEARLRAERPARGRRAAIGQGTDPGWYVRDTMPEWYTRQDDYEWDVPKENVLEQGEPTPEGERESSDSAVE